MSDERASNEAIGREGSNTLGLHPCVGYFDKPGDEAVYDPGWGSTPCLICWQPLGGIPGPNVGGNIRTHGLLHDEDELSLFYRTHIDCAEAHADEIARLDESVMHGPRGAWDPSVTPEALIEQARRPSAGE